MSEFETTNVIDEDYIKNKYNGLKNDRLEDIKLEEENVNIGNYCDC